MKRYLAVILLLMLALSVSVVQAGEERVEISTDTECIEIFPGQSETITVVVRSVADGSSENDPPVTYPPTTNPPTTNPPTEDPGPFPPPPPNMIDKGPSASLSTGQASLSQYAMMYTPSLSFRYEAPEGFIVSFSPSSFIASYDTDYEVDVKIEASDSVDVGEYTIPITVRSSVGHYDTIDMSVTILPYIDIVLNEVTISDHLPQGGDPVVFTASVTNYGLVETSTLTCAIYEKETNKRIATSEFSLDANETSEVEVFWTAVEGVYNFRAFVSSPENEKVTTNNFFFMSLKVGPALIPVDKGEEYFSQGMVYFESDKWKDAVDSFSLAVAEFTDEGRESKLSTANTYLGISQNYLEAEALYLEGIQARDGGDLLLAKEKLQAAESIYTELGDLEKISLCFNAILDLNIQEDDHEANEGGMLNYPWYTFTLPLVLIAVFLGYTRTRKKIDYQGMLKDLEEQRDSGALSDAEYIKEKYRIKLKMLEKYA